MIFQNIKVTLRLGEPKKNLVVTLRLGDKYIVFFAFES